MALQPFTKEQLNYFKFASIVLDEFPKALRQTFVVMWNITFGHQVWDDSPVVRNLLLAAEGGATKIPTNTSINDWDCTALFQATIFARSFALPDSAGHRRSLSDLYVKPRRLPSGTFHPSVISPGWIMAETFALAIDQLRLLRNKLCHSARPMIDKITFDQWVQRAKEAFTALGVNTAFIDAIGSLTELDFPVPRVQQLGETIKSERQALIKFLEEQVTDEMRAMRMDITESGRQRQEELRKAVEELKELDIQSTDELKRIIEELIQEMRCIALQRNAEIDEDGDDQKQTQTAERTEDQREIAAEGERTQNPSVKKGTPSDTELETVAVKAVDVWQSLGRRLGFDNAELTAFHKENEKYSDKSYQMLLSWKHKNANDATYQALNVALRHELVGRKDLAIQFCCDKEIPQPELRDASTQRELDVQRQLLDEPNKVTAETCYSLGISQYELGDNSSAVELHKRALEMRRKLYGEQHETTADSYYIVGVIQTQLGNYTSAVKSLKQALYIRTKLFGEQYSGTADILYFLGLAQNSLGDFTSAVESLNRAVDIRQKLLGEESTETANSYLALGLPQLALGDYTSAVKSTQRGVEIRRKLLGEEHPDTARSYFSLGITQIALRDHTSAVESHERALEISRKLLGEEHPDTASSYENLGLTQHVLGDYTLAVESLKRALEIKRKLLGEEHPTTAASYSDVGATQHALEDYTSAVESKKRALEITRKLFGEEHTKTADGYHNLAITQHALGDHTSAVESDKRAIEIILGK